MDDLDAKLIGERDRLSAQLVAPSYTLDHLSVEQLADVMPMLGEIADVTQRLRQLIPFRYPEGGGPAMLTGPLGGASIIRERERQRVVHTQLRA